MQTNDLTVRMQFTIVERHVLTQRVKRRAARNVALVGVVSCLAVTGFAAAVHGAGAASSIQSDIVSVDHTHLV